MYYDDLALEFTDVTKRYSRYAGLLRVKNFLDRVKNGQFRGKLVREPDFYALKNVSFKVRRGEKIGIIGPNGAGKSTTLKLIQGVTSPTQGRVTVFGKVGGLIELGTGFHQDLTGRENIYLNTAVNGMSRRETEPLVDKIIEIAEIDHFIDVPLKRYSSGMKVRLGFAVAMVFVPDVVLLDEVLAVGDARFKEKSLSMIQQYLEGRSLIFVSHSMSQISRICERCLVLQHGELVFDGRPDEAIKVYEEIARAGSNAKDETIVVQRKVKRGFSEAPKVEVAEAQMLNDKGEPSEVFRSGDSLRVVAKLKFADKPLKVRLKIQVKTLVWQRLSDVVGGAELALGEVNAEGLTTLSFSTGSLRTGDYMLELIPEVAQQSSKSAVVVFRKKFRIEGDHASNAFGLVDLGFSVASEGQALVAEQQPTA
jgi:ABC-type polysaccharide/polyol phosphate transport system ATPase subunit